MNQQIRINIYVSQHFKHIYANVCMFNVCMYMFLSYVGKLKSEEENLMYI